MSGGSREPESERDVQCGHCGRYYTPKGICGHEPNCPLRDYDTVLVEIEETTHPLDEDDEGADPPDKDAPAPTDPVGGGAQPATTDGGQAMAPPTFDAVDDAGGVEDDRADDGDDFDAEAAADEAVDDDDPAPIPCPDCSDGDMGVTEAEVSDGDVVSCESCGVRKRWRAEA